MCLFWGISYFKSPTPERRKAACKTPHVYKPLSTEPDQFFHSWSSLLAFGIVPSMSEKFVANLSALALPSSSSARPPLQAGFWAICICFSSREGVENALLRLGASCNWSHCCTCAKWNYFSFWCFPQFYSIFVASKLAIFPLKSSVLGVWKGQLRAWNGQTVRSGLQDPKTSGNVYKTRIGLKLGKITMKMGKKKRQKDKRFHFRVAIPVVGAFLGGNFGAEKKYLAPPAPQFPTDTLPAPRPAPPFSWKNPPPGIFKKKTDPRPHPGASDSPFPSPSRKKNIKYPKRPPRFSEQT